MLYPEIQEISEGEEGDRISIYVGVRNESTDSQLSSEIEFRVDDESYDEDPDSISAGDYDLVPPGESRFAGILDWYTVEGDAGTHDITVRTTSQGNEVTEEYTLGDATTFDVEIEDVRGIEIGFEDGANVVEVDWLVENNTGESGSTDITLNVDGTQEDIDQSVQFADSQERTGTLTWDAEGASVGEHDIEVTTTDDSAGQTFVVEEPDEIGLDVIITDTETVRAGNDADINYTATNRSGEGLVVHDVWLEVNGTEMDRDRDVAVDLDDQVDGTLEWPTTVGDVGETDVTVYTGFSGVDDTVTGQDTATVTVDPADPDPQFVTDGFIRMTPRDVQGSTTWDSENDWNQYDERQNIEITSAGSIRLAPPPAPPFFRVFNANVTSVEAGEDVVVEYGVRNTGDATATTDVWLEIEGSEVDRNEDVELGENEVDAGELTWQTEIGDVGEYDAVVHTADSSLSIGFEVDGYEPPEYGSKMYIVGTEDGEMNEYGVSETFDITTASDESTFNVSGEESVPLGMSWNSDGTNVYVVGREDDEINEYDVSIPFDITTASHSSTFDVSSEGGNPEGMSWNSNGTKVYVIVAIGNAVNEYTVSTPFDVTTASHESTLDLTGVSGTLHGMSWNSGGSKMYVVGPDSGVVEYTVSTPFDVTTASENSTFDISSEETDPQGMSWNSDGSKLYIVGTGDNEVNGYTVSTEFDITTASHESTFDVSGEESLPHGMVWNGAPQYE